MNYYEELGLSQNASPEEIKEVYRVLMRLLHPDHHRDGELQRVADLQVKKINQMYAVLSDFDRRRRYDQSLNEEAERAIPIIIHAPPPAANRAIVNRNSLAWVSAVSVFALLLVYMASRPTPTGPAYVQDSGAAPVETSPKPEAASVRQAEMKPEAAVPLNPAPPLPSHAPRTSETEDALRTRLAQVINERDAATEELTRLKAKFAQDRVAMEKSLSAAQIAKIDRAERSKASPSPAAEATQAAETKPPAVIAAKPVLVAKNELPPPPVMAPVIRNPLAGSWFYRKPVAPPKNKELYPPEFIETVITEDNGQLRGTYRARYRVPDRPVSPDVNFQFTGAVTGDSGSLPWSGAGGAKGQVTITLTAEHSLKVDWVASKLGSLGFYKGTAVLVKKAD